METSKYKPHHHNYPLLYKQAEHSTVSLGDYRVSEVIYITSNIDACDIPDM